ncbi:MAG: restriction endonuclease subunit S, partial [Bacteroidota bacterium]
MEQLIKQGDVLSLPKGWEIKKLGDVCDKASSNISQNQLDNEDGEYPIFGASGLIKNVSFYHQKKPYLSIVKDGSGVGRVTKMDAFTSVIGTLQYILPKENVDLNYLYYNLISVDFKKYIAGAAIPHIYFKDYKNEPFLWMPFPEQQRIVSLLDQTFAALANAKENAQRNLQNAKELFESYLQGVFEKNGKHCKEVKLSEIVIDITDGDHMPPPKTKAGIPFITISNINKESLQIDFSDTFNVSKEYYQNIKPNRKPKNGDILYTVTGSYGIPVLVETEMEFCFQRHIGLIRPKESVISKWLFYWILSPQALFQANVTATGTAQKTVSLTALRNFNVPKMTLSEQQTIVANLDALSAETKRLEAIYQQKLLNLEELKKTVLQ